MKLLLLPSSTCADPTYGRVLSSLGRELRLAGHTVRFLSVRPGKKPELELKTTLKTQHIYWCSPKTRAKALEAALKEFKPDYTHLHFSGGHTPWLSILLNAANRHNIKIALTFQDYKHPDLPQLSPSDRQLLRQALKSADRISAASAFLKQRLSKDYPACAKKIKVIGNAAPQTKATAKRLQKGKYILSVGRLAHYKGMDLLLMAYAQARRLGLRAPLVVCGADFQRGKLKQFRRLLGLEQTVSFAGLVSPQQTEKLLRGCLFFTLLSRFESFGMAALEAMACGKAALLSGAGGMKDFARNGKNALLVSPSDTNKAARLMLKLEQYSKLRERLGKAGKRTAEKLSWRNAAQAYLDFYRG